MGLPILNSHIPYSILGAIKIELGGQDGDNKNRPWNEEKMNFKYFTVEFAALLPSVLMGSVLIRGSI